jgi:hypothetical protein
VTVTGTSTTVQGLDGGTLYYWRVRAVNAARTSGWSDVWSFTTVVAVPKLVSPQNGETGVATSPTLQWEESKGAVSYEVVVSITSGFLPVLVSKTVSGTSLVVQLGANTRYYWRVRAVSALGKTDWSQVWSFTTKGTAKVVTGGGTAEAPMLGQNVPNPFNAETTISFDLPDDAEICLVIYDLTGRKVRTLVQAYRGQGRYTVVWDGRDEEGRDVASGVYLYRLEVRGRGVETKRMLLMR